MIYPTTMHREFYCLMEREILHSVENIESLIRRRRGKEQVGISQIERSFSQNQEEFHSFQYFELEINFERSLLIQTEFNHIC